MRNILKFHARTKSCPIVNFRNPRKAFGKDTSSLTFEESAAKTTSKSAPVLMRASEAAA